MKTLITRSPEETIEKAALVAGRLKAGDLVALIGELGTGKTQFVKGLAKGFGLKGYLYVNSPSFVVMKEYHASVDLYHFDVYRLEEGSFCDTLDYKTYFYGEGVSVVEWADKIRALLPEEYLEVRISHTQEEERRFEFLPKGERFEKVLEVL